jgi:hypothetical protein
MWVTGTKNPKIQKIHHCTRRESLCDTDTSVSLRRTLLDLSWINKKQQAAGSSAIWATPLGRGRRLLDSNYFGILKKVLRRSHSSSRTQGTLRSTESQRLSHVYSGSDLIKPRKNDKKCLATQKLAFSSYSVSWYWSLMPRPRASVALAPPVPSR